MLELWSHKIRGSQEYELLICSVLKVLLYSTIYNQNISEIYTNSATSVFWTTEKKLEKLIRGYQNR